MLVCVSWQEICIEKRPGEKLGISIRGGAKGHAGNPFDPTDEGIFISKVVGGPSGAWLGEWDRPRAAAFPPLLLEQGWSSEGIPGWAWGESRAATFPLL